MFDQAAIMRAHQTARSGPRGDLKGVQRTELPATGFFPQVPGSSGQEARAGKGGGKDEGDFQDTNLINYNFNNSDSLEVVKTQSSSHAPNGRPQNTKGMARFAKAQSATQGDMTDSDVVGYQASMHDSEESPQQSPRKENYDTIEEYPR